MPSSSRRLLAVLIAAAAAFLITPALASATTIAVFDDGTYVDTSNNFGAESDNLQASIAAKGYTVRAFTGITATSFSTALAGARVLVIPEQEIKELAPDLSGDAVHIIRSYVATGGGLIITNNSSTYAASFLSRVFGISVTESSSPGTTTRQGTADGTAFGGGPATLPENDGTNFLTGLPAGAASIYANGANSSVVAFTVGNGEVVFLGWDWYDSDPPNVGDQDGGWQNVLGRAIKEVAGAGCNITGSPGADTLTGTALGDRICAWGGNDLVNAGGGNDIVFAGKGSDTVNGEGGRDRLIGGAGADTLRGNSGNDFLDARDGVHGNDHLNGGTGIDTCRRDIGDHVISC
jgi:Ca2+-binding RTX toxin-like protein